VPIASDPSAESVAGLIASDASAESAGGPIASDASPESLTAGIASNVLPASAPVASFAEPSIELRGGNKSGLPVQPAKSPSTVAATALRNFDDCFVFVIGTAIQLPGRRDDCNCMVAMIFARDCPNEIYANAC
jgi:hypothetical protein